MHEKVAIIGLGYVGLPLAVALKKKKFEVVGFDISKSRIFDLKNNIDKNKQLNLKKINFSKKILLTSNEMVLNECDYIIVTVPTPIDNKKNPDLDLLKKSCKLIGKNLSKKSIIIFESTVFPGCTEEICVPLIEKFSKKKLNKNFYVGYSPERINVGDKKHSLENIIKIVSGSNEYALKKILKLYSKIIKSKVHICSSIKVAESAKAIENAQRDINIAFINEVSKIFFKLKINTSEVLKAAGTKWNFLNFEPGLVGGHCIGVDPYYLTYKAKKSGIKSKVILSGRNTNDQMPLFLSKIFMDKMKKKNLGKNILILGLSFKENVSDTRNSKVFDLIKNFTKNKFKVDVFDPIAKTDVKKTTNFNFKNKLDYKKKYDGIFVAVRHSVFLKINEKKIKKLGKKNCIFFDFKNIFLNKTIKNFEILKL